MIRIAELLWPKLNHSQTDEERQQSLKRDLATLDNTQWPKDVEVALEEARRLFDAEEDRRKATESKASIYLALVGVLIPIVVSLDTTDWEGELNLARKIVGLFLNLAWIAYLFTAGYWAFRALRVSQSSRVDSLDIAKLWSGPKNAPAALVREILRCVRSDRDRVNARVSAIRMTHAYLMRAAVAFTCLLVIQMTWQPISQGVGALLGPWNSAVEDIELRPTAESPAQSRRQPPRSAQKG